MQDTHSPLHPNHPATAKYLAVLTDSAHGICRVLVSNAERVDNVRMWISFCRGIPQRTKELDCGRITIGRIPEHYDMNNLSGGRPGMVRSTITKGFLWNKQRQ
jgi:hypothetical protein